MIRALVPYQHGERTPRSCWNIAHIDSKVECVASQPLSCHQSQMGTITHASWSLTHAQHAFRKQTCMIYAKCLHKSCIFEHEFMPGTRQDPNDMIYGIHSALRTPRQTSPCCRRASGSCPSALVQRVAGTERA